MLLVLAAKKNSKSYKIDGNLTCGECSHWGEKDSTGEFSVFFQGKRESRSSQNSPKGGRKKKKKHHGARQVAIKTRNVKTRVTRPPDTDLGKPLRLHKHYETPYRERKKWAIVPNRPEIKPARTKNNTRAPSPGKNGKGGPPK